MRVSQADRSFLRYPIKRFDANKNGRWAQAADELFCPAQNGVEQIPPGSGGDALSRGIDKGLRRLRREFFLTHILASLPRHLDHIQIADEPGLVAFAGFELFPQVDDVTIAQRR